jgi:anti-sigma factor RsiW
MKCLSTENIAKYQLSALSPDEMRVTAEHLSECEKCRREAVALSATVNLLENLPAPTLTTDLWPTIAIRIKPNPVRWWLLPASIGAAAMLIFGSLSYHAHLPEVSAKADEAASPYITTHQIITANDLLTDRAGIGTAIIFSGEMK